MSDLDETWLNSSAIFLQLNEKEWNVHFEWLHTIRNLAPKCQNKGQRTFCTFLNAIKPATLPVKDIEQPVEHQINAEWYAVNLFRMIFC